MSKSEDYLDDLLNAVSNRNDKKDITDLLDSVREEEAREARQQKNKKPKRDYGAEYYQDFLKELESDEENEFIRNFELEIDAEEARQDISEEDMAKETEEPEEYLGNIDGIVNEAKKRLNNDVPASDSAKGAEILEAAGHKADYLENFTLGREDPFADFIAEETGGEALTSGLNAASDGEELPLSEGFGSSVKEPLPDDLSLEALLPEGMELSLDDDEQIQDESKLDDEVAGGDSDDGLLELLSGLSEDSELSDISALLKADEDEDISELEKLESINELSDLGENKNKTKKGKKVKKKDGKVSKFMSMLFGEDEDAGAQKVKVAEEGSLENISDENLEILQEIDGKDKKKGKKNKKEKKEKEKKEKPKKEKKPPKPKKEKKPKEPDLSPPLPKKPIILIMIMAASIFILIMLGSNYVNYSNDVSTAKSYYEQGNYVDAYNIFSGMSVKEAEQSMSKNCSILAIVQQEYLAYVAFMDANQYEFALDSLICGIGRYDKFHERAEEYGILIEYEQLGIQIEQVLNEQFGVSREKALELYKIDRTDYSLEVLKILQELGLG